MRAALIGLLVLGSAGSASGETWRVREGHCGEWRSRWHVEQDRSGVWAGTVEHHHVGGPCVAGTGQLTESRIRAVIAGQEFFGTRQFGTTFCTYYGRVRDDRVRGFELCEGVPQRLSFTLRFPSKGGGTPSQGDERPGDDEPGEPRAPDQSQPGGWDFHFRGPRQ